MSENKIIKDNQAIRPVNLVINRDTQDEPMMKWLNEHLNPFLDMHKVSVSTPVILLGILPVENTVTGRDKILINHLTIKDGSDNTTSQVTVGDDLYLLERYVATDGAVAMMYLEYYLVGDVYTNIPADIAGLVSPRSIKIVDINEDDLNGSTTAVLSISQYKSIESKILHTMIYSDDRKELDNILLSIPSRENIIEQHMLATAMVSVLKSNRDKIELTTINSSDANCTELTITLMDDTHTNVLNTVVLYPNTFSQELEALDIEMPQMYHNMYKTFMEIITIENKYTNMLNTVASYGGYELLQLFRSTIELTRKYGNIYPALDIAYDKYNDRLSLAMELVSTGRDVEYLTRDDTSIPVIEIMNPILLPEVLSYIASIEAAKTETVVYSLLQPGRQDIIVIFTSALDYDISVVDYIKDELEVETVTNSAYNRILNNQLVNDVESPDFRIGVLLQAINEA